MQFRTEYNFTDRLLDLKYTDKVLSMGSCFADNMSARLAQYFYSVESNPFGTLYNPVSIRNSLALLLNNYIFEEADLFEHKERWHSFQHHSDFSHVSRGTMLKNINSRLAGARTHFMDSQLLMITFGTAWVYELRQTGRVVSNCHQLPANRFKRRRLSVSEIVDLYLPLIHYLREHFPALQLLFTVSPIRHLKDGLHENQISKATLMLAIDELRAAVPEVLYFPSYELMLDDLRDYRFYKEDMIHPSNAAISYIWSRFEAQCLSPEEEKLRQRLLKIRRAMEHRTINPFSEQHEKFKAQQLSKIDAIVSKNPSIDLSAAKAHFNASNC